MLIGTFFYLNSYGNFFHQIGIEWMNYVPIGSGLAFIAPPNEISILYVYPDRDFCIFAAHFPQNRRIKLSIEETESNVSLTYAWLCKYACVKTDSCNKRNVTSEELTKPATMHPIPITIKQDL
jgi:hypothetical protein